MLYTDDGRFVPYWYWQDGVTRDVILLTPSEDVAGSKTYKGTRDRWQELSLIDAKAEEYLFYS